MKTITRFLLPVILFGFISCDTTEPPIDNTTPGRRDYVWSIDTLDAPSNTYYRMWASSLTDIWCVSSHDWDKSIAHFDGESWALYGEPGLINLTAIYGFSNNEIFIGADNGGVWKFNGSDWELFIQLTKNGHHNISISNIWGESQNNFYAFGAYPDTNGGFNNSVIARFQNNNWTILNTDDIIGNVGALFKNNVDGKIYLNTYRIGGGAYPDSTLIFEYTAGKFRQLYSSVWTGGLQTDISLIDHEVYFILGNKIAKRKNNEFQSFLQIDNPNFYQRIWGRNSKDIFLLMTDGLAHYNGSDIEYLFYFNITPRTQIYGASLFEDDAFFLVFEAQSGLKLVYHGKLNENR